jgi:hypothetical protein
VRSSEVPVEPQVRLTVFQPCPPGRFWSDQPPIVAWITLGLHSGLKHLSQHCRGLSEVLAESFSGDLRQSSAIKWWITPLSISRSLRCPRIGMACPQRRTW